ncbi:hypothetical protein BH11ACT5_BH11ACT5_15720 [soil metagenome]
MLVLSDLHAYVGESNDSSPSLMNFSGSSTIARDLFERCLQAILRQGLSVDVVLVGGDISNHADPEGLRQAWAEIHRIAGELGAVVIATAGNHDYDSRGQAGPSPKQNLLALEPPFPIGTEEGRQHYFSYDFAVVRTDAYVVATVNSAANHGYTYNGESEHQHGRILESTVDRLRGALDTLGTLPPVRVLLSHHHLVQLPDIDTAENSKLVGSDALLRSLNGYGDWLVVHGHKHRAWLQYAAGNADSPVLLSAAAFSAHWAGGEFESAIRKQFHIVEFHAHMQPAPSVGDSIPLAGVVRSWTYNGFDWLVSSRNDVLSGVTGFGWRTSLSRLAEDIRGLVQSEGGVVPGAALLVAVPRFRYLAQDDLTRLIAYLGKGNPMVGVLITPDGQIQELYLADEQGTPHD